MTLAISAGLLMVGAVYLILQRGMLRIILGFILLSHSVNMMLFAAGGSDRRSEPLGSDPDPAVTADALPQAFVLTAIVIAFSITIYMLVLAVTGHGDDDTRDQVTDDNEGPTGGDSAAQREETPATSPQGEGSNT
ncbi:sodium:proton antiporter [Natronoglycomyces albus]|uniref:Cation:proton antiporter subunit C n=1 Tax=Natronoglycomyces albus TaxID=2811108 RepID=A0A895XK40_9ACTN|nr:cation:proton antiporter subunit C [Natronoglycomyces albus]QSB05704.1 cation:proton antiporter subunit C [Natronoglycomyces albus]